MRLRYSTVAGSGLLSQHSTLEVGGPIRVPMVWFLKLAIHNTYLYIYICIPTHTCSGRFVTTTARTSGFQREGVSGCGYFAHAEFCRGGSTRRLLTSFVASSFESSPLITSSGVNSLSRQSHGAPRSDAKPAAARVR